MQRRIGIGLLAAAALLGACSGGGDGGGTASGDGDTIELTGDDFGNAVVAGLGDDRPALDLAAFRGTPVVVNFFASTCAPCVREMPALEQVHQAAGDTVAFVGVAVNDRADDALELVERTRVTYDLAADPSGELFIRAGATVLPTTVILDGGGAVAALLTGEITAEALVRRLAAETGVEVVLS